MPLPTYTCCRLLVFPLLPSFLPFSLIPQSERLQPDPGQLHRQQDHPPGRRHHRVRLRRARHRHRCGEYCLLRVAVTVIVVFVVVFCDQLSGTVMFSDCQLSNRYIFDLSVPSLSHHQSTEPRRVPGGLPAVAAHRGGWRRRGQEAERWAVEGHRGTAGRRCQEGWLVNDGSSNI